MRIRRSSLEGSLLVEDSEERKRRNFLNLVPVDMDTSTHHSRLQEEKEIFMHKIATLI